MFAQWARQVQSITLALVLACAAPLTAQSLSREQSASIDATASKVLADTGVPAGSIAIVRSGKIIYSKAYGVERPGQPARTDARYPVASISKQFTAAAILMLADEGKLSLDDKVGKFLPHLTRANEVTIRQLLTHTAGYRDWWPQDYVFDDMTRPTTPDAILDRWAKSPLDFDPGTRFQYSNTGYVAAGLIVERVSRQPLFAFFRDHIFARLGMAPTNFDDGLTAVNPQGYSRYALGPVHPSTAVAPGWSFGAAGLVMSAADLARWDISVIDRSVMSDVAYTAQQQEEVLSNGLGTRYGLGVSVSDTGGRRLIEHEGGQSGFLSENRIYPDDRDAIVVLVNADFGNAEMAIADGIEQQLFANISGVGRARALLSMMRSGSFNRAVFTAHGNFYFTPAAIRDYRSTLVQLGELKSMTQTSSGLRGGLTIERFLLDYGSRKLELTLRSEPGANGRVEEFFLSPLS